MPELPEVETIRRDLEPRLVGRTIAAVELLWPRAVEKPPPEVFVREVAGRQIQSIARRGKYLIFLLSGEKYLVIHLRMTGRLLHRKSEAEEDPYTRAIFDLDDGTELRFTDLRKFAKMWLVSDLNEVVGKLGPEPFGDEFTVEYLAGVLAKKAGPIKPLLLDQTLIAGIGNIYADEALFLANIQPTRSARSLSTPEIARLHHAIRAVLALGITNRGTTFSDYRDAFGEKGRQQEALKVFRRAGQPCPVCGTTIKKIVLGGRGTFFCPHCQGEPA